MGSSAFAIRLTLRSNYVHDNAGYGLWTDIDCSEVLYEGNWVQANTRGGIHHEISQSATIRDNRVIGNRAQGIYVNSSANVTISNNWVEANGDGIWVLQENRGSGDLGLRETNNLNVVGNVVKSSGRSGLVQHVGDNSYFTSRNNRFDRNTYIGAVSLQWLNGSVDLEHVACPTDWTSTARSRDSRSPDSEPSPSQLRSRAATQPRSTPTVNRPVSTPGRPAEPVRDASRDDRVCREREGELREHPARFRCRDGQSSRGRKPAPEEGEIGRQTDQTHRDEDLDESVVAVASPWDRLEEDRPTSEVPVALHRTVEEQLRGLREDLVATRQPEHLFSSLTAYDEIAGRDRGRIRDGHDGSGDENEREEPPCPSTGAEGDKQRGADQRRAERTTSPCLHEQNGEAGDQREDRTRRAGAPPLADRLDRALSHDARHRNQDRRAEKRRRRDRVHREPVVAARNPARPQSPG